MDRRPQNETERRCVIDRFNLWIPVLLLLLFFGALFWAKAKDPYKRIWFTLKPEGGVKVEGVAVLPKPIRPVAVIIYLHDRGSSMLNSGVVLRQMAELGMAVLDIDYDQTQQKIFNPQFSELLDYVDRQGWAKRGSMAWVGDGLGAERLVGYLRENTNRQPQLITALSIDVQRISESTNTVRWSSFWKSKVLLVHDERAVRASATVKNFLKSLEDDHVKAELKILQNESGSFEVNRSLLFRILGEYCLNEFGGSEALETYHSIELWDEESWSLLWFWIPAFFWIAFWIYTKRLARKKQTATDSAPQRFEVIIRYTAWILASLALIQTGVHLIPPRLKVNEKTLRLARQFLISPRWREDFETLARQNYWTDRKLKTLLTHVELSNYNVYELINWKLDREIYNDFVLSPIVTSESESELNWRRPLWESFYPRIRKENTTSAAAEIVVRHLRERITIDPHLPDAPGIESIWKKQIGNRGDFEKIYVAAMRSCGIPARLGSNQISEFWTGDKWIAAPRPFLESWLPAPHKETLGLRPSK